MKQENTKDIEAHIAEILAIIEGPETAKREGLVETPKRVAKAYTELFGGYHQKPEDILNKSFTTDNNSMVIVKDIDYYSHCEHHMVPFFGKVHIGYIPKGRVLGLSKFARLTEVFARRLQIQEQMTEQIATALWDGLKPEGLGVVITGQHMCMMMRGVKKSGSVTITNSMKGAFLDEPETRSEFFEAIKKSL